jgi:hypothetical protein
MESTLILPKVTRAAENLESRAQGEGSNPVPSAGESVSADQCSRLQAER